MCAALGNGLLLGYLMYRSELVPRRMALLGLIGGPLLLASDIAILFGAYKQTAGISGVLTVPEAAWELSLGSTSSSEDSRHRRRSSTPAGRN